jgi:hypothetical protein
LEQADVGPADAEAVPAAPKIVTSVRRRGARRAAGPPPGLDTQQSAETGASFEADGSGEERATDDPTDSEPIAALVDAAEVDGSGVDGSGVDGAGVDAAGVDASGVDATGLKETSTSPATPHVPVKRRGSRRR